MSHSRCALRPREFGSRGAVEIVRPRGSEDAAASAPIQATSTADSENHGAKQAVDNDESSYWQSDPGSAGAQELTIDLGGARKLSAVEIVPWSFASNC